MFEAPFGTHFDDVAKSLGSDKCSFSAALLNQRIGGKRGAVNQLIDIFDIDPGFIGNFYQAVNDSLFRLTVIGQYFDRVLPRPRLEHYVGKGSADICTHTNLMTLIAHIGNPGRGSGNIIFQALLCRQ